MAPTLRDIVVPTLHDLAKREPIPKPSNPDALILEAWAQGYMVGSLIIMAAITIANMRRGVLLHKLILLEVGDVLSIPHGTRRYCIKLTLSAHYSLYSAHFTAHSCSANLPPTAGISRSPRSP